VLISIFLCFVTMFSRLLPQPFSVFNLRGESNFAALFSGIFLLIIALHAFDGWSSNRFSKPRVAAAWMMLSLVLITLSFDEIGSLHERLPSDTHIIYWIWVLPFALIYACISAYALVVLYRSEQYRSSAKLIGLGFLLFASVALQEEIEWSLDWSANRYLRFFKSWFRPVIEEGTELLGMILLLKASMINTRGLLSQYGPSTFPTLEAVKAWRTPVLILGLVGGPLVAFFTESLPPDSSGHGLPADWPAAALFSLAALAAARPYFVLGRGVGWLGWGLVLIAVAGCASTILPPESSIAIPSIAILSAAAFIFWVLDSRYMPSTYLPAGIFMTIGLVVTMLGSQNNIVTYTLAQYTALVLYWVNASAEYEFDHTAGYETARTDHA